MYVIFNVINKSGIIPKINIATDYSVKNHVSIVRKEIQQDKRLFVFINMWVNILSESISF